MQKYDLYLFDFDGTLFDTKDALRFVFNEAFKAVGITIKEEQIGYLSRYPLLVSYKELGAPEDRWDDFIDVIEETLNGPKSINSTKMFDEGEEFFNFIKTHNISIGIVTSNNSHHVQDILNHFNILDGLVKVIIGNQEAPIPKPDPLPINVALEKLGVTDRSKVVYVGDSKNDCYSAINAGVDYYFIDREEQGHFKEKSITNLMELFK